MALIVEDDLSISPFAYRWLRAARSFYAQRRDDIAGLTLQSEGLIVATSHGPLTRPPATAGPAFIYALVGTWGFAPSPEKWTAFQDWFHSQSADFVPLVPRLVMSEWYKIFIKNKKADTMWSMWFIRFCYDRRLFTVYSNIPNVAKATVDRQKNASTTGDGGVDVKAAVGAGCLSVNRQEPGLHYFGKGIDNRKQLLTVWHDDFVKFSEDVVAFGFDGKSVNGSRQRM